MALSTARIFAMGSGSDGLQETGARDAVIALSRLELPVVLYLGTATYDLPGPRDRQVGRFAELGCTIRVLDVANATPPASVIRDSFEAANVIIVSGGNTLFAVDRWKRLGMHELFREALHRGTVLAGGSAGAICWFDAGHSDSADPESFKAHKLKQADTGGDESSGVPVSDEARDWEYIRVPCLGFLPGLCCPHHDRTQSNGLPRGEDFDAMLLRHPGEVGICIDHWAALIVDGERYRVFTVSGKDGSVGGQPGVLRKRVVDGAVSTEHPPPSGLVADLLCVATEIVEDERVERVRRANPDTLA
jgi:dipeptidase E